MKYCILSILALVILSLTCFISSAHAGSFRFGKDTRVVKIQDIQLKGPNGESLFLGYLLETDYFLLGTKLEDKGYVIGVKGVTDGYYPLPDAQKMQIAKSTGLLPREFPTYTISPIQYAIGYSLWLSIGVLAMWIFLSQKTKKPRRL